MCIYREITRGRGRKEIRGAVKNNHPSGVLCLPIIERCQWMLISFLLGIYVFLYSDFVLFMIRLYFFFFFVCVEGKAIYKQSFLFATPLFA